jgi:hypothetical protein
VRLVVLLGAAIAAGFLAAAALAGKGDPQKKITPAGQARAKSAAITSADVGAGWKAETSPSSNESDPRCSYYNPDQSDLVEIGDFDSPNFSLRNGTFVSSTTGVFKTAAMAKKGYERVVRPELPKCLAELFAKGTGNPKAVKILSTGKLAFPSYRDRSNAYRVSMTVNTSSGKVPVTMDVVLINRGQIDVAMIFFGVVQPLPAAFERAVAGKVAARMK